MNNLASFSLSKITSILRFFGGIIPVISIASVASCQSHSQEPKSYIFGGVDMSVSWLDFPYIDQAVSKVNSAYQKTELSFPFTINGGIGYKTNLQLEYRMSLGKGGHSIVQQGIGNDPYQPIENKTIEDLRYSFQEILFKGSFLKKNDKSLHLIIGYNNSKIERDQKKEGFKGGGLTAGVEFTTWLKENHSLGGWSIALKRSSQKYSPTSASFFGIKNTMNHYDGSYWFFQLSLKFAYVLNAFHS